jgi:hypothetical protein
MNDLLNLIAWAKGQGYDPTFDYRLNGEADEPEVAPPPPLENGRLSANFTEAEFRCRCCGTLPPGGVSPELVAALQGIRDRYNAAVTINSGYRCVKHNRAVGGSANSQHIHGTAADFVVRGVSPLQVHKDLDATWGGGLGKYNSFTHIDVRPNRARW